MKLTFGFIFILLFFPLFFLIAFCVIQSKKLNSSFDAYYQAFRYYDPKLSRMIQADDHTPGGFHNPRGLDRFAYVFNSPFEYTDPSGHTPQDWEATDAYIVQHRFLFFGDPEGVQDQMDRLNMTIDQLNSVVHGVAEYTYKEDWDFNKVDKYSIRYARLHVRQNENFDQNSAQAQVFRGLQVAFTGDTLYIDRGRTSDKWDREDQKRFGRKDHWVKTRSNAHREIGNHGPGLKKHGSYLTYHATVSNNDEMMLPLGHNGSEILLDSPTALIHEIGHTAVEKSFSNGFSQAFRAAQEKTGFPFYVVHKRFALIAPGFPKRLPGQLYPVHPADPESDLKAGNAGKPDLVVGFTNTARKSLNEQLGFQKYAPRIYYSQENGIKAQNRQNKQEERMKDY